MQRELGSKGSAELKVLRILRLKKLRGEEIIGKYIGTKMYFVVLCQSLHCWSNKTSRMVYE